METLKYFRLLKEESAAWQPYDFFFLDLDSGIWRKKKNVWLSWWQMEELSFH